ncbi:MAG: hypothetical protein WA775_05740 [Psychroserpens sp.]|uniref:hypothetical protein n=1 Tax=Psychroserpens sp. TaxID=2020870 RepID=UPI003C723CEA
MKYIILLTFLACMISIICGFTIEVSYSEKLIGFGVLGLFLIVFPMFIYVSWKDKNFKDYMLTQENLDKMRDKQKNKKY